MCLGSYFVLTTRRNFLGNDVTSHCKVVRLHLDQVQLILLIVFWNVDGHIVKSFYKFLFLHHINHMFRFVNNVKVTSNPIEKELNYYFGEEK